MGFLLYVSQCVDPIMVITAMEENGNLKSYLMNREEPEIGSQTELCFLGMATDVAKGMAYLSTIKVHVILGFL